MIFESLSACVRGTTPVPATLYESSADSYIFLFPAEVCSRVSHAHYADVNTSTDDSYHLRLTGAHSYPKYHRINKISAISKNTHRLVLGQQ